MKKPKDKIMVAEIKTRDYLLLRVINGATKGGPHKDRRKEADKKACRKPVKEES